jgi:signal transduction histidine kinase
VNIYNVSTRFIGVLCLMFLLCRAGAQPAADSLRVMLENYVFPAKKRADLMSALAWELKSSDPKSAGLLADSALQIAQQLKYDYGIAEALHTKGMVYWYLSDYQQAVTLFFQSLEIREQLKDTLGIARSYNNIGNVYFLQENYDQAEAYYRQSLTWRQTLRDSAGLIYSYNNLADVMLRRNKLDAAEDLYNSALSIAANNLDGQSFIHRNMGVLRLRQDKPGEALRHFLVSKTLSESTGNMHNLALALIQIAELNLQSRDYNQVIENATAAFEIGQFAGLEATTSDAAQLLAKAYAGLRRYEDAYRYQLIYNEINERLLKKNSQNTVLEVQTKHELETVRSEAEKALLQKQRQIGRLIIISLISVFIVVLTSLFFWISRYRTQMKTALLLAEKNEAIQQQNEELLQSNIALEQYAFVASHDLKEPLRTVGSFASLLRRRYKDTLDEDGLSFIQNISIGVDQMSMLLEDLLILAQTGQESDSQRFLVNLNELVDKVLSTMQVRIIEQNVQVETEQLPTVYINPAHAHQLFQNLISNAVKFNNKPEKILRIGCKRQADRFLFSVADNGMGIAHDSKVNIFLPFHRLEHKGRSGAGLGLAICDKIVRLYGGTIWVESEPGQGSTFYFSLPIG